MKIYKFLLIIPVILIAVIYYSCDDSGVLPSNEPRGRISFSQKNLKHLSTNVDGVYELWLRIDSVGSVSNHSLGRFNIDDGGNVTETSGVNPMQFTFSGDTNILGYTTDAFITVEPPGDNNNQPSAAVLLSGQTAIQLDSLYTTMRMSGGLALGSAGQEILSGDHAMYMISTPTSSSVPCVRGIWFCDTSDNTSFPPNLQMTSSGWVYEGWLLDKSVPTSPEYYSTGRFTNPYGPDWDGAGVCAGPEPPYSKPGQDWVLDSCTSPPIVNISNGNYEVFVTIEPAYETPADVGYYNPFFLKIYRQSNIVASLGCYRQDNLFSQYTLQPEARIRVSY